MFNRGNIANSGRGRNPQKGPSRPCRHCGENHFDESCPGQNLPSNASRGKPREGLDQGRTHTSVCKSCGLSHWGSPCTVLEKVPSRPCKHCGGPHWNSMCPQGPVARVPTPSPAPPPAPGRSQAGHPQGPVREPKPPSRPCKYCSGLHWDSDCSHGPKRHRLTPPQGPRQGTKPPSRPCKHCGGPHWNVKCPQHPSVHWDPRQLPFETRRGVGDVVFEVDPQGDVIMRDGTDCKICRSWNLTGDRCTGSDSVLVF
jgi:hypothetical protein